MKQQIALLILLTIFLLSGCSSTNHDQKISETPNPSTSNKFNNKKSENHRPIYSNTKKFIEQYELNRRTSGLGSFDKRVGGHANRIYVTPDDTIFMFIDYKDKTAENDPSMINREIPLEFLNQKPIEDIYAVIGDLRNPSDSQRAIKEMYLLVQTSDNSITEGKFNELFTFPWPIGTYQDKTINGIRYKGFYGKVYHNGHLCIGISLNIYMPESKFFRQ